jgi:hypothetical protein
MSELSDAEATALKIALKARIIEIFKKDPQSHSKGIEDVSVESTLIDQKYGNKCVLITIHPKPEQYGRRSALDPEPNSFNQKDIEKSKAVLRHLAVGAWKAQVPTLPEHANPHYSGICLGFASLEDAVRTVNAISPPDKQIEIPGETKETKTHPRINQGSGVSTRSAG